jgi:hypothetical protein
VPGGDAPSKERTNREREISDAMGCGRAICIPVDSGAGKAVVPIATNGWTVAQHPSVGIGGQSLSPC